MCGGYRAHAAQTNEPSAEHVRVVPAGQSQAELTCAKNSHDQERHVYCQHVTDRTGQTSTHGGSRAEPCAVCGGFRAHAAQTNEPSAEHVRVVPAGRSQAELTRAKDLHDQERHVCRQHMKSWLNDPFVDLGPGETLGRSSSGNHQPKGAPGRSASGPPALRRLSRQRHASVEAFAPSHTKRKGV